ncbi:MAG: tetratricopeptide repeat protein [Blastocatellia bacterium]|nr:tetratricopeptide repeat protein [Blastocatellia bacterium]
MKKEFRQTVLGFVFFVLASLAGRADDFIPPGQVVEKVTCSANPQHSYAVYLPSRYTANRTWPMLFCFDPGARGSLPVERFRAAAEKYGFIVAGSNNSRNGENPNEAIKFFLQDTHERFAIDENRRYTAGFSGGARVATAIANSLNGQVAGVIACGGGYAQGFTPTKAMPYVVFGMAGLEDFNYFELRQLERNLSATGTAVRLVIFAGAHDWGPAATCAEAIEWFEIQALKTGKRTKDEKLIEELFAKALDRAQSAEQAQNLPEALARYQGIVNDFQDLKDTAGAAQKVKELKETKAVKEFPKLEKELERKQATRTQEFLTTQGQLTDRELQPIALANLKSLAGDLRKATKSANPNEKLVAHRVLGQFFVFEFEESGRMFRNKKYFEAIMCLTIAAEISPENSWVLFNLARAYILNGEKKKALEALQRAADKGFNQSQEIEQAPEFEAVRNEEGFKKVLESMKKTNPSPRG